MFTPRYGDKYYYITDLCEVTYYIWKDKELDWEHRNAGNCFETRIEAEKIAEEIRRQFINRHL